MSKVGIEVEVESLSVSQTTINARIRAGELPTWELDTNEGSLRGGLLGWELRTAGHGIPFEHVPAALAELYPVLGQSTGVWRSAIHVHVDVGGKTSHQRALALALAYVADYDIFRQVSPEREESNFCVPLENKTARVTRDVIRLAHGGRPSGYGKYSSVNILPMSTFGTMEFRHMRTPQCDNTVASIEEALRKIQHFVSLAHAVVTLGDYAPQPTTFSEVVDAFSMLAHNRFLWRAAKLAPRREAALTMMLALASAPPAEEVTSTEERRRSMPRLYELPARSRTRTVRVPEEFTWHASAPRPSSSPTFAEIIQDMEQVEIREQNEDFARSIEEAAATLRSRNNGGPI